MADNPDQFVRFDALHPAGPLPASAPGCEPSSQPLFGLDAEALAARMVEAGEPPWRGRQLAEALYRQRIADLDAITTLPRALRRRLIAEGCQVGRPAIAQVFQSVDGTERYLVQSQEAGNAGQTVETVWMPEGDGGESGDGSESGVPESSRRLFKENTGERVGSDSLQTDSFTKSDSSTKLGTTKLGTTKLGTTKLGATKLGAPSFPRFSAERVGDHEPHLVPKPERPSEPYPSPNQEKQSEVHRATICVSSQVGCAVNCQFCLTAKLGLQRNLTQGEIAGQVLAVFARHGVELGRDRVNLVFMGMGEPFLNYENFMGAVRLLVREVGLSPQRMTVSTSGIVPGIERFAQEPPEFRPKLAISLNAPNDLIRSQIMPVNRKWPIAAVIDAVRRVQLRPRERITFEYVLLGGVTDRPDHAREVARLLRRTGLPVKVNLIAWNPGPGIAYATPQPEAVEAFRRVLIDSGIPAYLRKPRGRDIYAACGQLKRTVEG